MTAPSPQKYCLDANVLINAWNKYYSPKFCPDYWDILNELGERNHVFLPQMVFEEIDRTEDDLSKWLNASKIPVRPISEPVTQRLKQVYSAHPLHVSLVDNTKNRSLADPWLIAHAIHEDACVVTKEEKVTAVNSSRIKIPNVCDNMKVRWINDFMLIEELGIHFTCAFKQST